MKECKFRVSSNEKSLEGIMFTSLCLNFVEVLLLYTNEKYLLKELLLILIFHSMYDKLFFVCYYRESLSFLGGKRKVDNTVALTVYLKVMLYLFDTMRVLSISPSSSCNKKLHELSA